MRKKNSKVGCKNLNKNILKVLINEPFKLVNKCIDKETHLEELNNKKKVSAKTQTYVINFFSEVLLRNN